MTSNEDFVSLFRVLVISGKFFTIFSQDIRPRCWKCCSWHCILLSYEEMHCADVVACSETWDLHIPTPSLHYQKLLQVFKLESPTSRHGWCQNYFVTVIHILQQQTAPSTGIWHYIFNYHKKKSARFHYVYTHFPLW